MAPARELAFQIFNEAKRFSKALGIRVACVYGELASGRDVVGKADGGEEWSGVEFIVELCSLDDMRCFVYLLCCHVL
jgi:superfamily II DNA/RNA helicase